MEVLYKQRFVVIMLDNNAKKLIIMMMMVNRDNCFVSEY